MRTKIAAILVRLGGVREASRKLAMPVSTVHSWARRGRIPAKHQRSVLLAAKANHIRLRAEDVIGD